MITPQMVLDALKDHGEPEAFDPYIDVLDTFGKERDFRNVVVDGNFNLERVAENLNRLEKEHARVVRDQKGDEVTFTCTVITSDKHGLQGHHQVKAKSRNGGGSAIRATYAEAEAVALARLNYEIEYG